MLVGSGWPRRRHSPGVGGVARAVAVWVGPPRHLVPAVDADEGKGLLREVFFEGLAPLHLLLDEDDLLPDLGGEEESRDRPQPGGERRAWVDERLVRAPWVVRADHARELLGKAHVELGASVHQEDDDAAAVVGRVLGIGGGEARLESVHNAEHDGVRVPILGREGTPVVEEDGAAVVVEAAVREEQRRGGGTIAAVRAGRSWHSLRPPLLALAQRLGRLVGLELVRRRVLFAGPLADVGEGGGEGGEACLLLLLVGGG
mmetsp:Transcript_10768/g.34110  ORF Transcript_10768/g.34110 Transcript_10768/m.34110 type:complete len:259 (-) Transcript_10768:90-866(-)